MLERRRLLQAIHDERDPAIVQRLKADFFSPEDKSNFDIRLLLRCGYVSPTVKLIVE